MSGLPTSLPEPDLTRRATQEKAGGGRRGSLSAWLARAPRIASLVLGIAVAVQAAAIATTLIGDFAIASGSGSEAAGATREARQGVSALAMLNTVRAAHLFGLAPSTAAAPSAGASRAPLVLTGIIATGDPTDGFAILGTSVGTAHVFHAGAEAALGTILAEVYPQRVVLLRGAERLILTLPNARTGFPVSGEGAGIRVASSAPEPRFASSEETGVAQEPPPESFKPPPMSDAGALMRAFSMRPVSIGGQRGVRIMGTGMNSKTLATLGLAPGDVILQINGVAIGSKDAPDLAGALKSGSATLVVDRDGDATSVTIDSSTAATAAQAYRQSASNL